MSDLELQLAALRAECDQEIQADGDWADVTVPAWLLRELIDRVQPRYHRGNTDHGQLTTDN